jgi:hypothetical protein
MKLNLINAFKTQLPVTNIYSNKNGQGVLAVTNVATLNTG